MLPVQTPVGMSSWGSAATVLSIFLCLLSCTSAETQNCLDVSNDVLYKAEDMEGTWYPIEIVIHRNDSKIYGVPLDTQCPSVTFYRDLRNKKILVMVWNSTEGDLEYRFQQRGRGQWQATLDQKGTLESPDYKPYRGIFRVFKLDSDFMFLTFCTSDTDLTKRKRNRVRVLNSLALSRSDTIPQEFLEETLKQLEDIKVRSSRVIRVPPCGEGDAGYSHRILPSCLLSILPSLVVRFPL